MHNVVVTGGNRGIGLAITRALIQANYRVIVVARQPTPDLTALVEGDPDQCEFVAWDLSQIETIAALARTLRGLGVIYGLVNNAGVSTSGILSMTPEPQIVHTFAVNVLAPITLTKYLLRAMMANGAGRVINIASIVATTGYSGLATYSASKAALLGFTRSLAREVGSLGITVNAIAPGFIDTEMTHGLTETQRRQIMHRSALQRMATAEDIAAAVVFLMTATNITGTTLTIDAGNTA